MPVGSPCAYGQDPFVTPHARPGMQGAGNYPGVGAWDNDRCCLFEPSRKENKHLFVFTADAKDYNNWRNLIADHLCRSIQKWKQVLDYLITGHSMIRRDWLAATNVNGINAWDLSNMLEAFLVDWLPKSMYNRRTQWSGG